MSSHIFLPTINVDELTVLPEHRTWLVSWLQAIEPEVERGDVAISMCLQGVIGEIALHKQVVTDWIGIMDEYLMHEGKPVAYSEQYGQRLYKFVFWNQNEVHAIHARWWIEQACNTRSNINFQAHIEDLIQPNGWIYNPQVSSTGMRTRMKSEYLMSLAMGIEILQAYGGLESHRTDFEGLLSSEALTGYLSAEHFRMVSLQCLDVSELAPIGLSSVLLACEAGEGYCDFDVSAKRDDYMGTRKRTERDIPVHSALSTLHALSLAHLCSTEVKQHVFERVQNFGSYIQHQPLDIQPFRMRDIDIPFGTGLSPLEVVAASGLVGS
jgi:hypothetical protein